MKFDDDALRASALSFQLIYRTRGLYQAFACLREFLEGHLPVARINGLYIPADHANVITMVDTLESRPVMVRREGRELPLLLWERLEEPLIVANLDPYKKGHTRGNPAAESLPFLRHHSLARLPVCRNEAYTFVINFWSDEYNAFARDDLTDLRIVTGGFVEELARDLEIEPGDDVICIKKRILADTTPVIYSIDYLPRALFGARDYTRIDLTGGVFDILERECHQQISSNVAHLKASCGDDAIRSAMRLAPGEAMLLLDEVCFNRLCRPVMRSLSYYTNFFDFSILRKLL